MGSVRFRLGRPSVFLSLYLSRRIPGQRVRGGPALSRRPYIPVHVEVLMRCGTSTDLTSTSGSAETPRRYFTGIRLSSLIRSRLGRTCFFTNQSTNSDFPARADKRNRSEEVVLMSVREADSPRTENINHFSHFLILYLKDKCYSGN